MLMKYLWWGKPKLMANTPGLEADPSSLFLCYCHNPEFDISALDFYSSLTACFLSLVSTSQFVLSLAGITFLTGYYNFAPFCSTNVLPHGGSVLLGWCQFSIFRRILLTTSELTYVYLILSKGIVLQMGKLGHRVGTDVQDITTNLCFGREGVWLQVVLCKPCRVLFQLRRMPVFSFLTVVLLAFLHIKLVLVILTSQYLHKYNKHNAFVHP